MLDQVLTSLKPKWSRLLDDPAALRLQICLTPLVRRGVATAAATETFRADAEYFYPASTVKLLASVCTIRMVGRMQHEAPSTAINLDTPLEYLPDNAEPIVRDETNLDGGFLTLRHCIRRALIVSENPPHNRLYEFLGHAAMNADLRALGFVDAVINHRLDDVRTPEEQRTTPRIVARLSVGAKHELPGRVGAPLTYPTNIPRTAVGDGHFKDGALVNAPMNFATPGAEKNRVRLVDLHTMVTRLAPNLTPDDAAAASLGVSADELRFLRHCMTVIPRESGNPCYSQDRYPDDYVKPTLEGVRSIAPRAEIMNKLGWAYGFVTDASVLHTMSAPDATDRHAVALSYTMWACTRGVLNNDDYDYEQLAKPFAKDLGRCVAERMLS
jgi:hypothetical protein